MPHDFEGVLLLEHCAAGDLACCKALGCNRQAFLKHGVHGPPGRPAPIPAYRPSPGLEGHVVVTQVPPDDLAQNITVLQLNDAFYNAEDLYRLERFNESADVFSYVRILANASLSNNTHPDGPLFLALRDHATIRLVQMKMGFAFDGHPPHYCPQLDTSAHVAHADAMLGTAEVEQAQYNAYLDEKQAQDRRNSKIEDGIERWKQHIRDLEASISETMDTIAKIGGQIVNLLVSIETQSANVLLDGTECTVAVTKKLAAETWDDAVRVI